MAALLEREKARRDAFRIKMLRLKMIYLHPTTDATPGKARLSDIPMTDKDAVQYASWESLAYSVWEYHQILANVLPSVKSDRKITRVYSFLC